MSKTYLDDLLDKHPHCIMIVPGYPRICRNVLYEGRYCDGLRGYDCFNCWHEEMQEDIPAVPHEMSTREYLAAEQRMCFDENVGKRNCLTCPLSSRINPARIDCGDYKRENPEEAVAIVEKWAREHPEKPEATPWITVTVPRGGQK